MIDTNVIMRNWILASPAITSLLGTNAFQSVYCGPDLPEHFNPALGPAIQIIGVGGVPQVDLQSFVDDRKIIKVWADVENYIEARTIYCAVQDLLNGATNQSFGVLGTVTRCMEVVPPTDSSDPDTGWACCHGIYQVLASANNTLGQDVSTDDGQTVAQYVAGLVAAEATRAEAEESSLQSQITAEVSRAEAAEVLLAPKASPALTGVVNIEDDAIGSQTDSSQTAGLIIKNTTAATAGQGQDPPAIEMDGQYWDGTQTQRGSWKIVPSWGTADNSSTLNFYTTVKSSWLSFVRFVANMAATALQNIAAPTFSFVGYFWNGSASATDIWEFFQSLGTGSNPTSTMSVLHFGSTGQAILDLANTNAISPSTPKVLVPNVAALDNSKNAANTAYCDTAVGVETTRATTAEALKIPLTALVDGTNAAGSIPKVMSVKTELAQSAVDAAYTTQYAIPTGGAGVYRITGNIGIRTKSSSSWGVECAMNYTGVLNGSVEIGAVNINTGSSGVFNTVTMYLHVGDVIQTGTFTISGSNTGGVFDACWVIERLA